MLHDITAILILGAAAWMAWTSRQDAQERRKREKTLEEEVRDAHEKAADDRRRFDAVMRDPERVRELSVRKDTAQD